MMIYSLKSGIKEQENLRIPDTYHMILLTIQILMQI